MVYAACVYADLEYLPEGLIFSVMFYYFCSHYHLNAPELLTCLRFESDIVS
jgi:hypothetical protein